jgi:putative Mg2+ transporter-C (MgtC) family protein
MQWQDLLTGLTPEMFVRVGLAFFAGMVLGIERERHGRAAGLRTTLMVCLASCIAMMISDVFYTNSFEHSGQAWHPDPARLAAGVLSGMGFLGAGVIIHQHSHVIRGVTTAATLWFSSIVGLCFGSGAIGIGLLATALSAVILFIIPYFEDHIENDWYADLSVKLTIATPLQNLIADIESLGVKVKGYDWREKVETGDRELLFHLKFKKGRLVGLPQDVIQRVSSLQGVKTVHWHG